MKSVFGALLAGTALVTSAVAQDNVTLRWATVFDAAVAENWQPVIDKFKAEHPNVDVRLETTAGSGAAVYPDVLRTSMASGDPADLFFMWGGSISRPFIEAGQVMPLNEYYEQYGWEERFPEWIQERLAVDGDIYGAPYTGRGMGFWYRKDIFAEHGLEEPETYADLENICSTLKEADIYCASAGGKFGWHTMRIVDYFIESTCGPEVHDQLNALEASWDQQCVVDAYQRMRDWIDNEWLVPDFLNVAPDDSRIPVYQGQAAMVLEGPWFEGALRTNEQPAENYAFFLPPTDQENVRYSAFPEQWMISAQARNPDVAAQFIDFITDPEVQNEFPTVFAGSVSSGFSPDCETNPFDCQWTEVLNSDRGTYPPTDQAFVKELMDSFFEVQDGIVAGRLTPQQGATLMQERAEAWKSKES